MNIWKIASRWSEDGNKESSILDLFRDYNIAFVYSDRAKNEVKKDDLIALSDGFKIVAVGKAIEDACKITSIKSIKEKDKERFEYSDNVAAVKLNIYDLEADETFEYKKIGRFHSVDQNKDRIIQLYEKHHKDNIKNKFSINASTYNFKGKDSKTSIIKDIRYIIPIYQRPYSWGDSEVSKFIKDIFISFWGYEKNIESQEPLFIGTMQLSEKKPDNVQYIIDGQQRITTFCLLIKYLTLTGANITNIDLESLLNTKVNNETQQRLYLECIKDLTDLEEAKNEKFTSNQYVDNLKTINSVFEEQIENQDENFKTKDFLNHLLTNIYFVVIETHAGLSKTIQIFNAINTTGLDLNGGDVFKIRMYEYLTSKKGKDNTCFNEISSLYEKVDNLNQEYKVNFSINDILYLYRDVLVSKYNMPNGLYEMNQNTFFDRLFDTILGNQEWNNFKQFKDIDIDITDLDRLIDIRYKWEAGLQKMSSNNKKQDCIYHFVWHSRYSRYWNIIFTYLFKNEHSSLEDANEIINHLNKLFFLYSVTFNKAIGNIKSFVYNLYKGIYEDAEDTIIKKIKEKMTVNMPYRNDNPEEALKNVLKRDIFSNNKKKYLICRLSAMLEGDESYDKLFGFPIDIEHIQPVTDKSENAADWDRDLKNSIGNLVVLERSINRSISNYKEKKEKGYDKSDFLLVKKLINSEEYSFKNWGIEECEKRRDIETKKIIDYIFTKSN